MTADETDGTPDDERSDSILETLRQAADNVVLLVLE
jgi:hypothetical protein